MGQEGLLVCSYFCVKPFLQFLRGNFSNFCVFHSLSLFFVITSNHKLSNNRKLLRSKA